MDSVEIKWSSIEEYPKEFVDEYDHIELFIGTLLKTSSGEVQLVGDIRAGSYDAGCGCCSSNYSKSDYTHWRMLDGYELPSNK